MNKKLKWGLIFLGIAGLIGGGIWYQQPKVNEELAGPGGPG